MLRMLFNPLILRPGVPPLAEGGNDFSATALVELFLLAFYSMSVWVLLLEGKCGMTPPLPWRDVAGD